MRINRLQCAFVYASALSVDSSTAKPSLLDQGFMNLKYIGCSHREHPMLVLKTIGILVRILLSRRVLAAGGNEAHTVALVLKGRIEVLPAAILTVILGCRAGWRTNYGIVHADVVNVNRAGCTDGAAGRRVGAFVKDDVQVFQRRRERVDPSSYEGGSNLRLVELDVRIAVGCWCLGSGRTTERNNSALIRLDIEARGAGAAVLARLIVIVEFGERADWAAFQWCNDIHISRRTITGSSKFLQQDRWRRVASTVVPLGCYCVGTRGAAAFRCRTDEFTGLQRERRRSSACNQGEAKGCHQAAGERRR